MDNKLDIPDFVEIKKASDLDSAVKFLKKAALMGELEQYWVEGNMFSSSTKIEDLGEDGTYPDYIEMYFRSPSTGLKYKLSVETYHGSGGEWSVTSD